MQNGAVHQSGKTHYLLQAVKQHKRNALSSSSICCGLFMRFSHAVPAKNSRTSTPKHPSADTPTPHLSVRCGGAAWLSLDQRPMPMALSTSAVPWPCFPAGRWSRRWMGGLSRLCSSCCLAYRQGGHGVVPTATANSRPGCITDPACTSMCSMPQDGGSRRVGSRPLRCMHLPVSMRPISRDCMLALSTCCVLALASVSIFSCSLAPRCRCRLCAPWAPCTWEVCCGCSWSRCARMVRGVSELKAPVAEVSYVSGRV